MKPLLLSAIAFLAGCVILAIVYWVRDQRREVSDREARAKGWTACPACGNVGGSRTATCRLCEGAGYVKPMASAVPGTPLWTRPEDIPASARVSTTPTAPETTKPPSFAP